MLHVGADCTQITLIWQMTADSSFFCGSLYHLCHLRAIKRLNKHLLQFQNIFRSEFHLAEVAYQEVEHGVVREVDDYRATAYAHVDAPQGVLLHVHLLKEGDEQVDGYVAVDGAALVGHEEQGGVDGGVYAVVVAGEEVVEPSLGEHAELRFGGEEGVDFLFAPLLDGGLALAFELGNVGVLHFLVPFFSRFILI